jgi:hypothetical protein
LPARTIVNKVPAEKRRGIYWVASREARGPKRPPPWVVIRQGMGRPDSLVLTVPATWL